MRAIAVASFLLLLLPASALGAQRERESRKMFNARYCEVLEVRGQSPSLRVKVWNTLGLNRCPAARWASFDAAAVTRELDATAAVLNGPRYFVMDRARARPEGGVRRIGGLRMRHIASIDIGEASNLVEAPYGERVINRRNSWFWKRGRRVYELIAPNGRRYVMQAYSRQVDADLSLRDLRGLGRRLALPDGWRYRSRRLKRPLDLTVKRRATIVRDELANAYQRVR